MNQNLTEIIFILDRSGSMGHLTDDTIGGFNSFIENQKKEEGKALLTTILFDDNYEVLHNCVDINEVKPLTRKEYYARGGTALLDAIGKTINNVTEKIDNAEEINKPSKVIMLITTDGMENSSREFNRMFIKRMVKHQQEGHNWQFIFLGANIDAMTEAESIGISKNFASNYTSSSIGTESLYATLSNTVSNYRSVGKVEDNWNEEIK